MIPQTAGIPTRPVALGEATLDIGNRQPSRPTLAVATENQAAGGRERLLSSSLKALRALVQM